MYKQVLVNINVYMIQQKLQAIKERPNFMSLTTQMIIKSIIKFNLQNLLLTTFLSAK